MIRSVDADGIRVGNDIYTSTIALTVDRVVGTRIDKDVGELTEEDFSELLDLSPEVIVLGTGQSNIFPPRDLVFAMARRGVGFEVMDTGAAARTYNVLAGEGRQVAVVLYL
jgi:uncharacterized protein